ncbi:MAG: TolC family protein [Bacteroidales bacterium]|nr:TolC family protein [Bacteroidales bacterium]
MKKLTSVISVILLIFNLLDVNAQQTHRVDYKTIISLAKQQNINVRNALYDVDIARKQVWETTAQGLPQVSSTLSYNNNLDLPVTLVPALLFNPAAGPDDFVEMKFGVQHNAQFNFQISQLVFNGSYIVGLQTAKTFKLLSEQNLQRTESEVVKNVQQSYFTLLFSMKNLQILQKTHDDMEKNYLEIKKTYEAGLAEETAADQLLLNKLTLVNAVRNAKRQIEVQLDLIKIQTGINLSDSIVITDSLDMVFSGQAKEHLLLSPLDISQNPDLKLLTTQEEINYQQVRLQKSTLLPSVNAYFSHSQSGQSDEFTFLEKDQKWFPSNVVGASISIPITTSGGTISRIKQAELELQKTKNSRFLLEQNLTMSAQSAKNKLLNEYETYKISLQNYELAERIYKRALVEFKEGMLSSTELTQLNTQYFNNQSAMFAAMLNVLNAQIELQSILGNQ